MKSKINAGILSKHVKEQQSLDADIERNRHSTEVNELRKLYRQAQENIVALRGEHKFIREMDLANIKSVPIEPSVRSGKGEGAAMLIISDVHAFENVDPKEVNWLNEYNTSIVRQSFYTAFKGGLKWTNIHRSGTTIKTCVVALLGDLMSGHLHPDQMEYNSGTPTQEVSFVMELVQSGLDFLLKFGGFDKIVVLCVDGNHSRTTIKPMHKGRTAHSYETMLYHFLASHYAGQSKISFVIADGAHLYQDIYSYKFRFQHGEAIRYQGGVGGLSIPINKAIATWNQSIKVDCDVMGHWHQFAWGKNWLLNGSMVGYNSFCVANKLAYEDPMQTFALVDKRRGIVSVNPIFVRPPYSKKGIVNNANV